MITTLRSPLSLSQEKGRFAQFCLAWLVAMTLAACTPPPPVNTPVQPPAANPQNAVPAKPTGPSFSLRPARFSDLPDWRVTDKTLALQALRRSCARLRARDPNAPLGGNAPYGGKVGDWLPACQGADQVSNADAREFFERNFAPFFVESTGGQNKLTGYYEPVFAASRLADATLSAPILARPPDLLRIDLSEFAQALGNDPATTLKGTLWGRVSGNIVRPYPDRAGLTDAPLPVIAYAHPADVYNLQVQGSGRLIFPDGQQARAAYSAPNGRKWNSIFKTLRDRNLVSPSELNFAGVRAWIDRSDPQLVREVFNTDPSVIFFDLEPIQDPAAGPRGAQGVPLTGGASVAIDPSFHPYGAVLYISAMGPRPEGGERALNFLAVAQDTGGAIRRGPRRADYFYGTGTEAGALAGRQNSDEPLFWTLLPINQTPIASLGLAKSG